MTSFVTVARVPVRTRPTPTMYPEEKDVITSKLKETVNGGNIMMSVDMSSSSSSSDGVERLLLLLVFICITGHGRLEEDRVSDTLCSVQIIRGVDKV